MYNSIVRQKGINKLQPWVQARFSTRFLTGVFLTITKKATSASGVPSWTQGAQERSSLRYQQNRSFNFTDIRILIHRKSKNKLAFNPINPFKCLLRKKAYTTSSPCKTSLYN